MDEGEAHRHLDRGVTGRKRIIRLMQRQGLKARVRKRFKCTTNGDHDQPVAANLLDREFEADRPNQKWVGDTPSSRRATASSSSPLDDSGSQAGRIAP